MKGHDAVTDGVLKNVFCKRVEVLLARRHDVAALELLKSLSVMSYVKSKCNLVMYYMLILSPHVNAGSPATKCLGLWPFFTLFYRMFFARCQK